MSGKSRIYRDAESLMPYFHLPDSLLLEITLIYPPDPLKGGDKIRMGGIYAGTGVTEDGKPIIYLYNRRQNKVLPYTDWEGFKLNGGNRNVFRLAEEEQPYTGLEGFRIMGIDMHAFDLAEEEFAGLCQPSYEDFPDSGIDDF